jgi:catechol 2,3-dioxygenase-like lactoylglutathione lyase family enzyme
MKEGRRIVTACARNTVAVLALLALTSAAPMAQLAAPNDAGVRMGHLHYQLKDVEANTRFWTALGGRASRVRGEQVVSFPDVVVVLTQGPASGGTDGSVLNHVAFRVPSLEVVEAAGLTVQRLRGFPGVASVTSPEGERIELFENAATNLTFTPDAGRVDARAERHNRPLTLPIAFHHIHLYVPDDASVAEAKAWYVRMFGGTPGVRGAYQAVDLPGVNINISAAPKPTVPTKGRMLDHVGFEVARLQRFAQDLTAKGVTFDQPYARGTDGVGRARLTDPWGTSIELTEGF